MLDDLGFHRPTYAELLAEQETRARQLFGDDIETGEATALGKYIRLNTYDYARLYELAEKIYYARFPNFATGVQLDRLTPFANISRNPATVARHIVEFYGIAGKTVEQGSLVATGDGVTFYTLEDVTMQDEGLGLGTARVTVECTEFGTVGNVAVGEIDRMGNPNGYVREVRHIALKLLAKDAETDKALRERFHDVVKGTGSGTWEALYGALGRITNVDGVVIVENDTAETVGTMPPHSFQCYIVAPNTLDQQIGQTIFDKKPIGIKPLGEVEVTVLDSAGSAHVMRFSRAIEKQISLQATIKKTTSYPEDGTEQIKTNIANLINGLSNGDDVILSRLYSAIHAVEGVAEVADLKIKAGDGAFAAANIICLPAEFARIQKENIDLTVVQYVDQ